jgi:hypothetical protein
LSIAHLTSLLEEHFSKNNLKVMKKVQAGCRLWAFCLLVLLAIGSHGEVRTAFNTTKESSSDNVHGGSRIPGGHSSSARSASALGPKPGFVTAPGDGHLYLNDELFDFRSFKWVE